MPETSQQIRYTPLRVLAWTWTVYLGIYFLLAPFDYGRSISGVTVGYLMLCLAGFAGGCWQVGLLRPATPSRRGPSRTISTRIDRVVYRCAVVGVLGTGMILAQKLLNGEVSFSKSIGEVRLEQVLGWHSGGRGSLILVLGMATYSFSNVAVMLYILCGEKCSRATGKLICLCWFSPALIVVLYGGRSSAVLMLAQVMVAGWIRRAQGKRFLPRAAYLGRLLAIYSAVVVAGFLYVFASRAAAFGDRTSVDLVYGFSDRANAEISPEVLAYLDDSGFLGGLASTTMMTLAYATHSLPELDYLLVDNTDAGPYYGGYQFDLLFKALSLVTGTELGLGELGEELHHQGWFLTALGGMYLDFGFWLSPLVLFGLGTLARYGYLHAVQRHSPGASLLLVQLYVYLVGSPVHSTICTGNSLQTLFSSLVVVWYLKRQLSLLPRRRTATSPVVGVSV
jgi:hypothetical protein